MDYVRELVRTNDPVFLSWLIYALRGAGIEPLVFDTHTAILEGSVNAIQRRVMVGDDEYFPASRIVAQAEGGASEGDD
jgi:putative signal transducing protein